MGYSIKQWITTKDYTCEDVGKARTADDAIKVAREFSGIFKNLIDENVEKQIREMDIGDTVKIKRAYLGYTIRIKRTKS